MAGNLLGELFVKIGADTKAFKTSLTSAESRMNKFSSAIQKHHKAIGLAMTAAGAAIVGSLAMSIKAYAKEEAGIERLRVAMANMGLSYDDSRESLEKWINAEQQKTAIADSDQRDALASLIRMTGDLGKAQNLLTLAMDVAVGTGKDLASANTMVMYALGGNWGMVERYIPALKTAATEEEKWALLHQMFAGQAEAYGKTMAGQMQLLKNNLGDVGEAIGGILVPALKSLIDKIMPIIENIKVWIEEHPELTKKIVIVTAVIGGLLLVLGSLLLLMPGLTSALAAFGITLNLSLGGLPIIIGAIATAIAFLATAWATNMGNIREKTEVIVEAIVHAFGWLWDKILTGVKWAFKIFTLHIRGFAELLKRVPIPAIKKFGNALSDALDAAEKRIDDFRLSSVSSMENFSANFTKTATKVKDATQGMTQGVDNMATGMQEDYKDITDATTTMGTKVQEVYDNIAESAEATVDKITKAASKIGIATTALGEVGRVYGPGIPEVGMPEFPYWYTSEQIEAGMKAWEASLTTGVPSTVHVQPVTQFQKGGIVTKPIMALLGERGKEAVVPLEKGGLGMNLTVNFTEPIIMENEGSIGKLADKIYAKIKQNQRLSFGEAYSG